MATLEDQTTRFIAAWMQLRQMIQAANFNRFQQAGLSATQFMTLNVIPPDGMTLSELARKLNLSLATLSETVKSLEERSLVRRVRMTVDARKVNICATVKGEEMQNTVSAEFRSFIAGLFSRVNKSHREGLLAGLEQMIELGEAAPQSHATASAHRRPGVSRPAKRSSPRSRQL